MGHVWEAQVSRWQGGLPTEEAGLSTSPGAAFET